MFFPEVAMMAVPLNVSAIFLLQEATASPAHDVHLASIWLVVIAVALVMQAVGVVIAAIFAMKLFNKMAKVADSFEQKTGPLISKTTTLVEDLSPRLRNVAENAEQMSFVARDKIDTLADTVDSLNRTVQDINERSRVQISRVDGIVSDALATTYEVSRTVQDGIRGPVRQVAGIIAAVQAGLETWVARLPFGARNGRSRD